jgi:hypothetical protein
MSMLTVRDLDPEVKEKLRQRPHVPEDAFLSLHDDRAQEVSGRCVGIPSVNQPIEVWPLAHRKLRSASRYRIDPADLVEAGEVTVRADQGKAVLDADRRQYRIGDQSGS